jgi:hypothetical protein
MILAGVALVRLLSHLESIAGNVAVFSYERLERPMIRLGHHLAPPPTPGRIDLDDGPAAFRVADRSTRRQH